MRRILFCGDNKIEDAARYLAGVMKHLGYRYDHFESDRKFPRDLNLSKYGLIVLSDYPGSRFRPGQLKKLAQFVREGGSFWMIGGWGSFRGFDGRYAKTPVADILPVEISVSDDRIQGDVGYRLSKNGRSKLTGRLQFRTAPIISGYNRCRLKKGMTADIKVQVLTDTKKGLGVKREDPLLVTGYYGKGKVAAYMSDLAPHWSGGLVDWGRRRISIKVKGKTGIEVSDQYVSMIANILEYLLP